VTSGDRRYDRRVDAVSVVLAFSDSVLACWPAHLAETRTRDDSSLDGAVAGRGQRAVEIELAQRLPRRCLGQHAYLVSSSGEGWSVVVRRDGRLLVPA
jgi:hypothetical protein